MAQEGGTREPGTFEIVFSAAALSLGIVLGLVGAIGAVVCRNNRAYKACFVNNARHFFSNEDLIYKGNLVCGVFAAVVCVAALVWLFAFGGIYLEKAAAP